MKNYISRVRVKNYRSLADTDVALSSLNVFVGKNGSGKSNFIDAIRFVADSLLLGLDAAITKRGGIGRIRRWSPQGRPFDVSITIEFVFDDSSSEYSFTLGSEKRNEYRVKRETYISNGMIVFQRENDGWKVIPPSLNLPLLEQSLVLPLISDYETVAKVYNFIKNTSFYTIYPNTLREPQKPTNPYPLDEHGDNLASVLRGFSSQDQWSKELKSSLGKVIDGVIDFKVQQVGGFFVTQLRHIDGSWLDLFQESDGTLRVLGLLVALYQFPPRTLVALEEPELTIHPGALSVLCDVIRETAHRSQVLITTHSPDLIARFALEELRIVERTEDGTAIGMVDDVQKQVIEEQLFSTSDLLRIEGLRRAQ